MEGRALTFRQTVVRRRLAALIACSLIATIVPLSVTAEYGIPAGSGATITAGQPLLVRVAPGWDAEVSYEIADGSYVTVWGAEQAAPDGTLWYPVDGGFVPAEAVTSVAAMEGGMALYQEAAPAEGWVDPATGLWVDPAAAELAAAPAEGWVDSNTGEWFDPNASMEGWVDPTTGQWVDPNTATVEKWVDPVTGQWVDANAASEGYVDPVTGEWVVTLAQEAVTTDERVDPSAPAEGSIDPTTGEWVDPNAAVATEGWVEPATGVWVEPAGKTEEWLDPAASQPVEVAPEPEWVEPAPVNTGGIESWSEPIGTAYIAGTDGDGAACRAAPERGTEKISVLFEGEPVEVRGEAIGEWQPVNCAGVGGYVNTSLISWEPVTTEAVEQKRRNKNRGNSGANAGNDGTASATGNQVVDFAMQYVGYPYQYAGEGPYAFDCSGFTKFVILNTLGIDITHDMFQQIEMGQPVGRNELQSGDLVFFANTFRPGLSHNGVYIGDGQFVHAENESTGVKVSDLDSDYYSSRWYGATRLAA